MQPSEQSCPDPFQVENSAPSYDRRGTTWALKELRSSGENTPKYSFGLLRLVFTSDGVVVGVVIKSVERCDLVKIKPTESKAEHCIPL